jgi:hypothetical protein
MLGNISRVARFKHSSRSRSLSKVSIAILTSILLAFASLGTVSTGAINKEQKLLSTSKPSNKTRVSGQGTGPGMQPMLVAPLFMQDEQLSSTLSFVNASSVATYATVTLRSLSGQTILQKKIPLPGSSPVQIAVQQLLQEADSSETRGSILVEQSPDLNGLAVLAQLSITYEGSHASYIDEELAMPDPSMGSSVLRGVARASGESNLVAISSLSQSPQEIRVDCLSQQGGPISNTLELAPNATVTMEICSHGSDSGGPESLGVQLVSSAGPGQFAAFGITRRHGDSNPILGAIPFTDPKLAASSSTVFAGLPVGAADLLGPGKYKPYVAVANFSLHPAHVTVRFNKTSGNSGSTIASDTPVADISLPPWRTQILPLVDLQGDPGMRNSFVVDSDAAPGDISVSMASKAPGGGGEVELLGKDAQQPENAGAHPWSIAHGNESTLLVFNHTDHEQRMTVVVLNGKDFWQRLIKLSALETIALSMSQIIKNQVPDDLRRVLPPELTEGEIIWTMGDPKTITGRLLVSNRIADMARNFSCSPTAELCGAALSPTSGTIPVNGSTTFYTSWSTCLSYTPGQCNGPATTGLSPNFSWTNGSAITQTCSGSSSCSPVGTSPGTAALTVYVSSGLCTQQASSNVTVTPSVSFTGGNNFIFEGSDLTVTPCNIEQALGTPTQGNFSWSATTTSANHPNIFFNGSSSPYSTSSDVVTVTGDAPSSSLLDTTLTVNYSFNNQSAQTPATRTITIRLFKFLQQSGSIQVVPISGQGNPPKWGYTSYVYYNIFTNPGGQQLQPGCSNISVYESVILLNSNFPSTTVETGSGNTGQNAQISDSLTIKADSPLPTDFSASADQYLGVGGFIVRHNTISWNQSGPSITNLGPLN